MLRDLADQRAPVALGHPVVGLDLVLRVDLGLEARELHGVFGGGRLADVLDVEALRVHAGISNACGMPRRIAHFAFPAEIGRFRCDRKLLAGLGLRRPRIQRNI